MPTTNLIVFRIDESGHSERRSIERCLYLAAAHRERGGKAHFVISTASRDIQSIVKARGIDLTQISSASGSMKDCEEFLAIASKLRASSLIIDGSIFQKGYLESCAHSYFTAVIDDKGGRPLPVQLIISSAFASDERFYTCRADTTLLLGPKFRLLDPEMTRFGKPKSIGETGAIPRYYIGCADEHTSARILDSMPSPTETTILCISGPQNCPILASATRYACARGYTVEHITMDSVSDNLPYCDAAIGCPDSVIGSLAYYGIPTLVIASDNSQSREVQRLAEEDATIHSYPLDQINDGELRDTISGFISDREQRQRVGECLSALVDGQGASRILDCITESARPKLRLLDAA